MGVSSGEKPMPKIEWLSYHIDAANQYCVESTTRINDLSQRSNVIDYIANYGKITYVDDGLGSYWNRVYNSNADYFRSASKIYLPADFTMSCWVNVHSVHPGTANGILTNHDHATDTGAGICVKDVSGSDFRISCNTGDGTNRTYNTYYGTTNIKDSWNYLTVRWRYFGGSLSLLVNGVVEYSTSYSQVNKPDYIDLFNWSTSYGATPSYRPNCDVGMASVWSTSVSDSELLSIYENTKYRYGL
jgi:hypothetical protein